MSFTWAKGRQLQGITKDGLNASYTYDENGLRISKTVNGVTTKIFRTNGQMVGMNMSDGKDMTFILDGDGNVYGVHYDHYSASGLRSETYYFAYNAQGDVIGIYDFSGRLMAAYDYDEWGNCTVNVLAADSNGHAIDSPDHIAHVNPFRYRGYFYDAETGFYYLNSRYYDPGTGRFINSDIELSGNASIQGYNLFAYCMNNPVNMQDTSGRWPEFLKNIADKIKDVVESAVYYVRELILSVTTDEIIETSLTQSIKKDFPTSFMDKGLAAATTSGHVHVISSGSSRAARGVVKGVVPIVTTLIDFGLGILHGESFFDAGVKSIAHTAIGMCSAKIGMAIGTCIGGPVGTAFGAVAGYLIGTGVNIIFDMLYDTARAEQR